MCEVFINKQYHENINVDILELLPLLALANSRGISPGIFLGNSLENGASWLKGRLFLKVSRISFSQASWHHFPGIFLGIFLEIFLK